ncbi:putative type II secretion system protein HxcR [Phycisphaerales bacterium]|nr:putative type II secretion system protein HxcR [Phycisphaerales bacterium]
MNPPAQSVEAPAAEGTVNAGADPAANGLATAPRSSGCSKEFLATIPHEFARRHLLLSIGLQGEAEHLLVTDRTDPIAVFNVGTQLRRRVVTQFAPPEEIAAAIDREYAHNAVERDAKIQSDSADLTPKVTVEGSADVEGDLASAVRDAQQTAESDLLSVQGKAPVVRLVDLLIFEALLRGASDVHVQPIRGKTLVRYRLDGVLHTVRELPGALAASVVSRIKVMSRLDVAEQRAPQDGRAGVTIGGSVGREAGRRVDLRISTLPSTYGERVVIRLLDPGHSPHLLSFGALGMPAEVERSYLRQASRTSGIVLSTGPTGSGKTTTLYTTLAWISSSNAASVLPGSGSEHVGGKRVGGVGAGRSGGCELNIMTIEDPVEYDLATAGLSVSQTQVDTKKGMTFAAGLRHILRQDPDVIMVGEIRDDETARIAVQASLTGHLVLSTLHTNDAPSAVARLLDLGAEPFLVSSTLAAVLAQRLVRKTHAACGGQGCEVCLGTGYKGRTGVFELLVLDAALRELVGRRVSAAEIKIAALRAGMVSLRDAGATLVAGGVTTREEVARVIESLDEIE